MRTLLTAYAIALATVLAACSGPPGPETTDSASSPAAAASHTPVTTVAASSTQPPTPDGETSSASPGPTQGGPLGDARECENEVLGYEVDYPGEWWANDRVEPEDDDLTAIAACQYFAPNEVELQPNAGLPNGIAVYFEIQDQPIDPPESEILSEEDTTVDELDARIVETEPAPQAGFIPEGSRMYSYLVDLEDGSQLVARTDNILQDDALYQESKAILDAMMETLEIED